MASRIDDLPAPVSPTMAARVRSEKSIVRSLA